LIGMKSGKQRREEIMQRRRERAAKFVDFDPRVRRTCVPWGVVEADRDLLARHNNTYGLLPLYYVDREFTCRDCGSHEVWTAKQQKWWYEVALGNINSTAVRCRPCRRTEQARAAEARRVSEEGMKRKLLAQAGRAGR
jgi:DNA-directed RNA polymerase subunit M/transcription elongation factor TFIIS